MIKDSELQAMSTLINEKALQGLEKDVVSLVSDIAELFEKKAKEYERN